MDEITRLKAKLAKQVEDGQKIDAFTSTPEWVWFVDHVINPTIEEYTARIVKGEITEEKQDWITRGIIQGLQLVVDSTGAIRRNGLEARKKALEVGVSDD